LAVAGRKFVTNYGISVELKLDADAPQPGFRMQVAAGLNPEYAHLNHRGLLGVLERRRICLFGSGFTDKAMPLRSLVPGGGKPSASNSGTTSPVLSNMVVAPARIEN
jgi:hypothetical protein